MDLTKDPFFVKVLKDLSKLRNLSLLKAVYMYPQISLFLFRKVCIYFQYFVSNFLIQKLIKVREKKKDNIWVL